MNNSENTHSRFIAPFLTILIHWRRLSLVINKFGFRSTKQIIVAADP